MTFVPMLSAMEEFEAAAFNALHGFYRQSIGCARNALEVMTVGSACHTLKHHNQFKAWQNGDKRFGFGAACDLLIGVKSLESYWLISRMTASSTRKPATPMAAGSGACMTN